MDSRSRSHRAGRSDLESVLKTMEWSRPRLGPDSMTPAAHGWRISSAVPTHPATVASSNRSRGGGSISPPRRITRPAARLFAQLYRAIARPRASARSCACSSRDPASSAGDALAHNPLLLKGRGRCGHAASFHSTTPLGWRASARVYASTHRTTCPLRGWANCVMSSDAART